MFRATTCHEGGWRGGHNRLFHTPHRQTCYAHVLHICGQAAFLGCFLCCSHKYLHGILHVMQEWATDRAKRKVCQCLIHPLAHSHAQLGTTPTVSLPLQQLLLLPLLLAKLLLILQSSNTHNVMQSQSDQYDVCPAPTCDSSACDVHAMFICV